MSIPDLLAWSRWLRAHSREYKAARRNVMHVLALKKALRARRRALGR